MTHFPMSSRNSEAGAAVVTIKRSSGFTDDRRNIGFVRSEWREPASERYSFR